MDFVYRGRRIGRVGLFGLGRSNLGVMRYLSHRFPNLTFTLRADKSALPRGLHPSKFERMRIGHDARDAFDEDLIFLSPSIRKDSLSGIDPSRLTSDAEFYFENTAQDVFSITGSDGKSTTTTLTSLMLSRKRERVCAIGNIGVAMTPQLGSKSSRAAVELSSFQLLSFIPHSRRALITNISENHLDFHKSMDEYVYAKSNVLKNADERVMNYNAHLTRPLYKDYPVYAVYSLTETAEELRRRVDASVYVTLSSGMIVANGTPMLDTHTLKTETGHNIENFMAAIALTYGFADHEQIRRVGSAFSGIAHRCEYVGTFSGVRYINSSIDSTPTRTATTLSSLGERVIVILGGKNKGLDYRALLPTLKTSAKKIILTGEARDEIASALLSDAEFVSGAIPFEIHEDFSAAIEAAILTASHGDTVLLSPASASFDAHKNFEERGEKFKQIIRNHYYKGT